MSNLNKSSALGFLIAISNLITSHRIECVLEALNPSEEPSYCDDYLLLAQNLASKVGLKDGLGEIKWNPELFLSAYSELSEDYFRGLKEGEERILISRVKRANNGVVPKVTVYCPRGCNSSSVYITEPVDECAACGQEMHPEAHDVYCDLLVKAVS